MRLDTRASGTGVGGFSDMLIINTGHSSVALALHRVQTGPALESMGSDQRA